MSKTVDLGVSFNLPELAGKPFPAKGDGDRIPKASDGYIFRIDLLRKTLAWIAGIGGKSLYLTGPAGAGKTSLIEQVAARLGWGCTTLSCNVRSERADIVGYMGLKDGSTSFVDGPLVRAMREGEIIVFDEGDALPPSITIVLNRVLEGAPLVIPETGETVQPHPDFRVAFTGNTKGRGDNTGNFRGRQTQDAAVLDRFCFIEVGYPTPDEEKKILDGAHKLPEDIRDLIVRLAGETRQAHMSGDLSAPLSTRGLVRVAGLMASGLFREDPIREALRFSYTDGLEQEEAQAVFSLLEAVKAA